jgi:multidrug resistance efflux pump
MIRAMIRIAARPCDPGLAPGWTLPARRRYYSRFVVSARVRPHAGHRSCSDDRRRSRIALFLTAAPALGVSLACSPGPAATEQTALLGVTRGALTSVQLLSGELMAERTVAITVPDVGIRPLEIRWMVENGATVAAGDALFELDNTELASRLEESRVVVLEARSQIATAESQAASKISDAAFELERRRAEFEKARIDASIPRDLRSQEEYQRLQLELEKAQRRVADAERLLATARATAGAETEKQRLQLGKQEAALRQVENGIAQLAVTAPNAGVVLIERSWDQDRRYDLGDVVYPGHRLAVLPDLESLVARARLFDVDDGRVEPGMRAKVELDAHPGFAFDGVVRAVDRIAFQRDRDSSARIFWVTVDLASLDLERMRAGMSVKVTVDRGPATAETGVRVPRESLDLSDLAVPRVRLRDGSWRTVELGECAPLDCVVRSGLTENDLLGRASAAEDAG